MLIETFGEDKKLIKGMFIWMESQNQGKRLGKALETVLDIELCQITYIMFQ